MARSHRPEKQMREVRLPIVAKALGRGLSVRAIRELLFVETGMRPALSTVHKDTVKLLDEWRKNRQSDFAKKKEQELMQIENTIEELWEQWDKSKMDQKIQSMKQKGEVQGGVSSPGEPDAENKIVPLSVEKTTKNEVWLGDPRYIAEIRAQQQERRKLEGLYAPEQIENINAAPIVNISITQEELENFKRVFDKDF